jgi:hypothetical protein
MKLFASLAFLVINPLLGGYLLAHIWAWFVVPVFALPLLPTPHAIGLWVFAGVFLGWNNIPLLVNMNARCKKLDDELRSLVISAVGTVYLITMLGICYLWWLALR